MTPFQSKRSAARAVLGLGVALSLAAAAAPASSAGKAQQKEPRRSVSLPDAGSAPGARFDHRKAEVLQGVVFALMAEKHCQDFTLSLSRVSRLLQRHGFKPNDLGPTSRHAAILDPTMEEARALFSENPRGACELALSLVGEDGEIADLSAARPSLR